MSNRKPPVLVERLVPRERRLCRLVQLFGGLALYGLASALCIKAGLGLDPWGVFHDSISRRTGFSYGQATALLGGFVMLLWWPLRQRPGLGTISNALLVGPFTDIALLYLADSTSLAMSVIYMVLGILATGIATGAYLGAGLGPGPRDGLMTGISALLNRSPGLVRTGLEASVLATGWLLGGTVGPGTICFALAIGPLVQIVMPAFQVRTSGDANGLRTARAGKEL